MSSACMMNFQVLYFFRNGHLMTHRDKKPYQCMVIGCEKSYCDARSLKRHLENHHQHTSEQISKEMVAAASAAAEVLADASNALPIQATPKGGTTSLTSSLNAGKTSPGNSVSQSSTKNNPVTSSPVASDNKVLAQQLMLMPNLNTNVPVLVTMAVNLPEVAGQNSLASTQQMALAQYEALLKQQEHDRQIQFLQEQQAKHDVIKIDSQKVEVSKVR
jgi:uncharacterized Zn-finger protein